VKALLFNGLAAYVLFKAMDLSSDNVFYSIIIPLLFASSVMMILFVVLKVIFSLPQSR